MCTVTFIPLGNSNFVLTSNRDEAPDRETLAPDFYMEDGVKLLYPKDKIAGGTWIGVSSKKRLICLLNGGFEQHTREENYRMSRGVVVKDLLSSGHFLKTIETYNFLNIEPFTSVIVDWKDALHFYELVWDGVAKHVSKLPLEPRIWSSTTLYTEQMKIARLEWFQAFKNDHKFSSKTILEFHKTAGKCNQDYGVIMDRSFVKTTSITQIEKQDNGIVMNFFNLQQNTRTTNAFNFEEKNQELI